MKNIINISDFNEIVKGIKAMKSNFVYVSNTMLLGTDEGFNTLKIYRFERPIAITENFTIITKVLKSDFYNSIIDVDIVIDTDINKIYCASNKSIIDNYDQMITLAYNNRIITLYNNLNYEISMSKVTFDKEITSEENFQRFKTIKAGEGADLYVPDGINEYGMYLYSGAVPMTKTDRVYLTIYDNYSTFIGKFTIFKKKCKPVELYIKFIKLVK